MYFSARLAANPVTTSLAGEVEALLTEIDLDQAALRDARREEVRKRAVRDHEDDEGDDQTRRYRRRIGGVVGGRHFVLQRLFPRGVRHAVAPRGREQLERLNALLVATDEALLSPQLAADPDAAELTAVLQAGKTSLQTAIAALTAQVTAWETQTREVARAQDALNFRRTDGVSRLGVVMGELRATLGGSSRAAYAYTQTARGPEPADADADADDADDADDIDESADIDDTDDIEATQPATP